MSPSANTGVGNPHLWGRTNSSRCPILAPCQSREEMPLAKAPGCAGTVSSAPAAPITPGFLHRNSCCGTSAQQTVGLGCTGQKGPSTGHGPMAAPSATGQCVRPSVGVGSLLGLFGIVFLILLPPVLRFELRGGGQCVYLHGDWINSTLCHSEKFWVCSTADSYVRWKQKAFPD